ncbi:YqjF family protein [Psychroserpens sp. MEBiC05023]
MTFLKAYWKHLILINYEIDPKILEPYIPNGTTLDFFNDRCYVSVVGFMFMNTKVLGLKLPYHINFEEVNLRFYVKHNDKRGVVFIKEIVPKPLITTIANTIYHEHYQTNKMAHKWTETINSKTFEYRWKLKNNRWQSISVETDKEYIPIENNTEEQFITEHYFGYTKHNDSTFEYEVVHPTWRQLNVKNYDVNIDFEMNYGSNFKFLNNVEPTSVILAEGSEVRVKNKTTIH